MVDEKAVEITEEHNSEDNSKDQPKPSISLNKDFYFVWQGFVYIEG